MTNSNKGVLYGTRANGGQHGDVFTSPTVVRYMLDVVGYTSDRDLGNIRILEPSCGEGEFVVEIALRLKQSAEQYHFNAYDAFLDNVRAYDIDSDKIDLCRKRLEELGFHDLEKSVIAADFLKASIEEADVVVGNPPYIRYENIPEDMLSYCRETFSTFHYRCDLYVPFFEKTLKVLKKGGVHCFICSNRWMKNEYGKKLREMISQSFQLTSIINLEQASAFQEEVLAYPSITVIHSQKHSEQFEYSECSDVSELGKVQPSMRQIPKGSDWTSAFNTIGDASSLMTIEQQGFKIGIGVATGADSVFVSSELPQKVEKELIIPGINARDLRGNKFEWQGEYLLNPYKKDGTLVNLEEYPLANAYLQQHKERLAARHIAKKSPLRWYKTIDRISPALRSQPKILLPDMSGNTFVFVDDGEFYPLHNIYYIVGRSSVQLRLLAAFLMSEFVRNQLSAVTNKMNGGFSRWQSQHLRKLRLPNLNTIPAEDVQQILSHYEERDISVLNKKINKLVREAGKVL